MTSEDSLRSALKTELWQQIQALGAQQALFPLNGEPINETVRQLEALNPVPQPLQSVHSMLLGDWQLEYASRGTVVTRKLASDSKGIWEGVKIDQVWQRLALGSQDHTLLVENGAVLDFFWLGKWQLKAEGVWRWGSDHQVAKITFDAFSIQALSLGSEASLRLPELKLPIIEFLRKEALWTTSYLDSELRAGRGATGNLFVFRRQSQGL